ncbi:MAG: secondary thiamine-phosphate synthase enzyme YjbQ [Candidatus Woesearchaeota archaeon]
MKIFNETIKLKSNGGIELIDLNSKIKKLVKESKTLNGFLIAYIKHTTAGLKINENEPRLLKDISNFLEKAAPRNNKYFHDDIHLRDCPENERINAHSHLKHFGLNTSETIPIVNGSLVLGKWQSLFFVEVDGTREREIHIQIIGE